jgi:hypothetical protein
MVNPNVPLPPTVYRNHRNQRGAAIFVVISVVTVLTAIGMFAAHNAGLNQRLSGYARQATQSEYVADYGTMAVVNEMSTGAAPAYMQLVASSNEVCRANQYTPSQGVGMPCYRLTRRDLEQNLKNETGVEISLFSPSGLSSSTDEVAADFVVEMTDPGPAGAPVAGMDQTGIGPRFRYMQLTFSGTGQVRPASSEMSPESIAKMSAVRANRAIVQVGPLPY